MKNFKKKLIFITLIIFSPLFLQTSKVNAGGFGAEIFCTMRDGGNDHESSWDAAYTYIKKQKGGFFKVSPKQAAALITETVIREREKFSFCVEYLDKLHPNRKLIRDLEKKEAKQEKEKRARETKRKKLEKELEKTNSEFSDETIERYSY
ncbi:MAG: secretion system protein [Prochlorococcus marinus XMU1428]|nr:secretion system protein [Prochlorococcus marinus XMU1428]